jgi:hypothetical protein
METQVHCQFNKETNRKLWGSWRQTGTYVMWLVSQPRENWIWARLCDATCDPPPLHTHTGCTRSNSVWILSLLKLIHSQSKKEAQPKSLVAIRTFIFSSSGSDPQDTTRLLHSIHKNECRSTHPRRRQRKFNHLKPSGNYIYHLLQQSATVYFVFMGFIWFSM